MRVHAFFVTTACALAACNDSSAPAHVETSETAGETAAGDVDASDVESEVEVASEVEVEVEVEVASEVEVETITCDTGVPCHGECIDVTANPLHCGACDHDCGGGTCVDEVCQPVVLVGGLNGPNGIAVNATHVIWGSYDDGTIETVTPAGASRTTLATDQTGAYGLAIDAAHACWTIPFTDTPHLACIALGGASGGTVSTIVGSDEAYALAIRDGVVYWSTGSKIVRAPIDAVSSGDASTVLATDQSPEGVAVDASYVYWGNDDGTIRRTGVAGGGAVETIASGQTDVFGVAVDAVNVYWVTSNATGTIAKAPTSGGGSGGGGNVTVLATGRNGPAWLTTDAEAVYWADYDGGILAKVPIAGGEVTTLATGQLAPAYLAVDGTTLYWTNTGGDPGMGAVMKIVKRP